MSSILSVTVRLKFPFSEILTEESAKSIAAAVKANIKLKTLLEMREKVFYCLKARKGGKQRVSLFLIERWLDAKVLEAKIPIETAISRLRLKAKGSVELDTLRDFVAALAESSAELVQLSFALDELFLLYCRLFVELSSSILLSEELKLELRKFISIYVK